MTISKKLFYPSSWVLKSCITSYQKIVYVFSSMFIYKNIFMHKKLSSNGIGSVREEVLFYFIPPSLSKVRGWGEGHMKEGFLDGVWKKGLFVRVSTP